MSIENFIPKPSHSTQSVLLISRYLIKEYPFLKTLKGKKLTDYLNRLLRDPDLEAKLRLLKTRKWKKQYQEDGLDLQRAGFFPLEEDWARLSMISNGTGYSRCFIFIFLLKFDLGIYTLAKKKETSKKISINIQNTAKNCFVSLNNQETILLRIVDRTTEPH